MSEALRPDTFVTSKIVSEKKAESAGATEEEKSLYALSQQSGWVVIQQLIEDKFEALDDAVSLAIADGADFAAIGQKTVVLKLAKEIVSEAVLEPVTNAIDVVEKRNGE